MLNINISTLIILVGSLVFLTNVIVEVFKNAFFIENASTINKIALLVAVSLTVLAYLSYSAYTGLSIFWYYLLCSIILGFVVSLIAMLGWDKVIKIWKQSQKGGE